MSKRKHSLQFSRHIRKFLFIFVAVALTIVVAPTVVIISYTVLDPPLTPLMILRHIEGEPLQYRWRDLENISDHLARAVIAAEDNFFCRHNGFDVDAVKQELLAWRDGKRPRGASTITMQTAKNILLWPDRNLARKAMEAWMTPQIEMLWSKRRILEIYLNIAEMGSGIYGAEAAARAHFGKSAKSLNRRESATLAATLPNPRQWSASSPSPFLSRRAREIQRRIKEIGLLLDCY